MKVILGGEKGWQSRSVDERLEGRNGDDDDDDDDDDAFWRSN